MKSTDLLYVAVACAVVAFTISFVVHLGRWLNAAP